MLYCKVPAPGGYELNICIRVAQTIVEKQRVRTLNEEYICFGLYFWFNIYPLARTIIRNFRGNHLQSIPSVRNSSQTSSVTPRSIHTQGHSSILGATHSILCATSSTTYLGIYQPFITPTTHPRNL